MCEEICDEREFNQVNEGSGSRHLSDVIPCASAWNCEGGARNHSSVERQQITARINKARNKNPPDLSVWSVNHS